MSNHPTTILTLLFAFLSLTVLTVRGQVLDATFSADANDIVYAVAVQTNGKILVGGRFTTINGVSRNGIARINADGSLDASFTVNVAGVVECIAIQSDGKIIIGGLFTSVDGQPRSRIARLHPDGTLDSALAAVGNNVVFELAVDRQDRILLGGTFTFVGGVLRVGVARLNRDGTLDATFNPGAVVPNELNPAASVGGVYALHAQSDGSILIGGAFEIVGGMTRTRLARLRDNGEVDDTFNPTANATVLCIAAQDEKLIVGGIFTRIGGQSRNFLARLQADGTLDPSFNTQSGGFVRDVVVRPSGKFIISGDFSSVGGARHNRIAQLARDGVVDASFTSSVTGSIGLGTPSVYSLAEASDGTLVAGGSFNAVDGMPRAGLFRFAPPREIESSRLRNISVRSFAGVGDDSLIVGFNLAGPGTKPLLIRGVGPSLAAFGVDAVIPDPAVRLDVLNGGLVAQNNDWPPGAALATATATVGAFPLISNGKDAAMLQPLAANSYTAQVGGGSGVALVEVYDTDVGSNPRLTNVSARTRTGTGSDVLIVGFVVAGETAKTLLLRAIGPTLRTFGLAMASSDVRLELRRLNGGTVATNDDWGGGRVFASAFAQVNAFALPADSRDAALLVTLPPGGYTAQVSGDGAAGIALVEVYEVP